MPDSSNALRGTVHELRRRSVSIMRQSPKNLHPSTRFVLLVLLHYCDDAGVCWPSQQTIEEVTGYSSTAVRKAIKALEEAGAISVQDVETAAIEKCRKRQGKVYKIAPEWCVNMTHPHTECGGDPTLSVGEHTLEQPIEQRERARDRAPSDGAALQAAPYEHAPVDAEFARAQVSAPAGHEERGERAVAAAVAHTHTSPVELIIEDWSTPRERDADAPRGLSAALQEGGEAIVVQVPQVYIAPPPHVMAAEPGESDALLSARIARERAREATQEAARAKLRSMQEAARSWTPGQIRALYAPTPEEAQQEEEERQRKQAREEERLRARAAAAPIEEVDGPMAAADYDRLADRVARDLAEYAALHGQEPVAHPAVLALLKGGRNQGLTTRAQWHHWYAWACAELARHSVAHEVAPSTRQVVSWLLTDQVQRYAAERERMIARTLAATGRPAQEVAR